MARAAAVRGDEAGRAEHLAVAAALAAQVKDAGTRGWLEEDLTTV